MFYYTCSLCFGLIAAANKPTATAPAATLMVIHQYNAKGPLVDLLLPVVAFDDALGLIFFSLFFFFCAYLGAKIQFSSLFSCSKVVYFLFFRAKKPLFLLFLTLSSR